MTKVQELFNRIQESKKEQKGIKQMYSDALKNHQEYQKLLDEIKALRDRKKKIEESVKDDFSSEFSKLDTLKADIENDTMLMSDAALTQLVSGKTVEVIDEKENRYEPVFGVKFRRV